MNSSLKKALVSSMLVVGGAVSALGQGFNYDLNCIDPNNTAPYSTDFGSYYLETPLWQVGIGVSGTVAYKYCVPGASGGGSVPVAGRFQFGPGPQGSIQDNLRVAAGEYDVSPDDYEDFQWGTNHGISKFGSGATSGSGWSYARIQIQGGSDVLFGGPFEVAYIGASNRYMTATQVSSNTSITLQIDLIGDAARFQWLIANGTGKTVGYGLELGQWVVPVGGYAPGRIGGTATPVDNFGELLTYLNSNGIAQPYVWVPGLKPRETQEAFGSGTNFANPVPTFVDFGGGEYTIDGSGNYVQTISPQLAGGEQIVNAPFQDVEDESGNSDQTPVDEFDLGDTVHLLDGEGIVSNPVFNNTLFHDVNLDEGLAFAQKWYYSSTANAASRTIVCYYRSIWGDSNYFNGYTAVVDTPKALAADLSTPGFPLNPNPFTVEVDIDNTGVFGNEYQEVNMDSVEVDLNLPPGMYPAGGSTTQTTIKKFISAGIPARQIGTIDFQVAASPSLFGPQPYTVTIIPSPGTVKTIKGTINVAASPRLQLTSGANLISLPWYNGTSWDSVLGLSDVRQFQAYDWDPTGQQYVPSSGSERRIGTWIVTTTATTPYFTLGGSPQQPADEFPPATGAPNLPLEQGWNLIGNPYNYSFPLGQLVGAVGAGSFTYDQLVTNGVLDGSFAYYDPNLQTYDFLGADTDEILPNHGYWVYCAQPMTLVFPPVYDFFDRSATTPTFQQYANHWKLQLSAKANGCQDLNNFFSVDTAPGQAAKMAFRKPPISEAAKAVRVFLNSSSTNYNNNTSDSVGKGVKGKAGASVPEYQQMAVNTPGKHAFNMSVYATQNGPVTLTWPNLSTLPKNLAVEVVDMETRAKINARGQAGYSYQARANLTRSFQVTITPEATVRQSISSVSTVVTRHGSAKLMTVDFTTATGGIATIGIYQNGKQVATVETNQAIVAGKNSAVWGMTLSTGKIVKPGSYTMVITAMGDGGDVATKYVTLNL